VRKIAFLFAGLIGAVLFVASAQAQSVHLPAGSTWKLNMSASDFGGMPAPKSDVFTVMQDMDSSLKFKETMTDPKGVTTHTSYSAPEDGKMHPVMGMKGQMMSMTPSGMSMWSDGDGNKQNLQESLSADGKQLTLAGTMTTKDGKSMNQKWVYDRIR
jgi:hypothetical protein